MLTLLCFQVNKHYTLFNHSSNKRHQAHDDYKTQLQNKYAIGYGTQDENLNDFSYFILLIQ